MAPTSFLDRITSPRNRSPISSGRPPSEYQLDQLDPRPDDASVDDELPQAWLTEPTTPRTLHDFSPDSSHGKASSVGSYSKIKPRKTPMFAGPPPPIASSVMMSKTLVRPSSTNRGRNLPRDLVETSPFRVGSLLFDQRREFSSRSADSVWRGLQRQEKALEEEVQQLLDLQATALVAGSGGGRNTQSNDTDGQSDTGSSTPTGTFYSTKSSRSRMISSSLYVPTRATPDGNVIPVRQPTVGKPLGLRATRAGLKKSMIALAELKQAENAHIEAALFQRKEALEYLTSLSTKQTDINAELHTLEGDEEEPLGKRLRDLNTKHDSLDQEIRLLEEKLVGMRNRRRLLREKIDNVKNRREAGLSGYRGALKDVDSELWSILRRPPIQPLDSEMLDQDVELEKELGSPGGPEFLRLIPERRTVDMAKSWWENEVVALERRKARIESDHHALEEGTAMWNKVIDLVMDFESSLRQLTKPSAPSPTPSGKGKGKVPTQEETIRAQLPRMGGVVADLEEHMHLAEEKRWNLLICAIGAELEAFKEAYSMLESLVGPSTNEMTLLDDDSFREKARGRSQHQQHQQHQQQLGQSQQHHTQEESDNEVPSDLLVSHSNPHSQDSNHEGDSITDPTDGAPLQRCDSENEIPPEFLAEHESVKGS